jgi:hypothetical protein
MQTEEPKSRRVKGDLNAAPIGARSYACFTGADRAKVWAVLIGADKTDGYLYGLVTRSSWQRGAPIQFQAGQFSTAVCSLMGRVLVVQPPCRLSYLLRAGPEDPPVYLTWHVRPCPGGSTVRLRVDEIEHADSDEEAENTWLPVLAALQALLARDEPVAPGSSRIG